MLVEGGCLLGMTSGEPVPPFITARAPKVLLHDHLDGGLRPETVLELATDVVYSESPASDAESLGRWFAKPAYSGSLER